MKNIFFFLLFPIFLYSMGKKEPKIITKYADYLDTSIIISLYGDYDVSVLEDCIDILKDIEAKMSPYDKTSELYRLNEKAGQEDPIQVSDELYKVIKQAYKISKQTKGIVDLSVFPLVKLWSITSPNPKVPKEDDIKKALSLINYKKVILDDEKKTVWLKDKGMKIDLGFVAKGYAADMVIEKLKKEGVKSALLNFGGNVYLLGKKPTYDNEVDFSVGIQNPLGNGYVITLQDSNISIVTSGVYERFFEVDEKKYHHLLDVKTGYPKEGNLLSVSIIGKKSMVDDTLSTAFFLLGKEKGAQFLKKYYPSYKFVAIDKNKNVFHSKGLVLSVTDASYKLSN